MDKVKNPLDTEVVIVEGSAKGKGTNDGPVSLEAHVSVRANEVFPDSGGNIDAAEQLGWGVVVGGGAK